MLDNDTRGWILSAISGVACCFGASIICIDVFVRQFPHMHDFKIAESDAFLSASLSLSAGVIMFSSLYSMLPESKTYLKKGGYSPQAASFLLIGLFLVGVFGIRILSQIMHRFIPSHIVDCDHTHEEATDKDHHEEMAEQGLEGVDRHSHKNTDRPETNDSANTESTPLLPQTSPPPPKRPQRTTTAPVGSVGGQSQANTFVTAPNSRRASSYITQTLSRTFSKYVSSKKDECDEDGPCMGFSDPCGQDCFKIVQRRGTTSQPHQHRAPSWQRVPSDFRFEPPLPEEHVETEENHGDTHSPHEHGRSRLGSNSASVKLGPRSRSATHHYHHPEHDHGQRRHSSAHHGPTRSHSHAGAGGTDHHHHVPTNAFMSIGLQTSVAIALHKAPEGFITFATNHANPTLGFSVFIALFIHNITEGFALSLPLFLALNSRLKAILWSSILGGLSQPIGAGIAALWFKLADQNGHLAPDEKVYGGIFAVTSGVMASVALSLLSESLQLSHNKNTCVAFAFLGMGLLGVSMALAAS